MASEEYNQQQNYNWGMLDKQFDTEPYLYKLYRNLIGVFYNEETQTEQLDINRAYLNQVGAKNVINEIEGRIQNITASANLKKQDIADIRQDVWLTLTKKLYVNRNKWEITTDNYFAILRLVDNSLLAFLSRTEESSFFNKLSNFFNRKETMVQQISPMEEKKKRFSF